MAIDVNANRAANNVQLARENGATAANIHTPTEVRDGLIGGSVSEMSDVVYCGEVLERVPNPAQTLGILRQIATDRVIVTTRCVPATIQTDAGSIQFTDNSACFVPAAGDVAKSILETFEANQGRDVEFINGTAVEGGWLLGTNDEPSAVWWVWTDNFVQKMIESAGFSIVQARETAQAGVKSFVCQVA